MKKTFMLHFATINTENLESIDIDEF